MPNTVLPAILELAESTFLSRKEALDRRLHKDLAKQIQDHLNRGLLSSTVWLNARREIRQEHLRETLKERIDSIVKAYEEADRCLDDEARGFLVEEVGALCRLWESAEERKMVEDLCRLGSDVMGRYWEAVNGDMVHEHNVASSHLSAAFARHKLVAERQRPCRLSVADTLAHLHLQNSKSMNKFRDLLNDHVALIKATGAKTRGAIKAAVDTQNGQIIILDVDLPIEVGDFFERVLPNGMTERFEIEDPGYQAGLGGIPAHYQARVRRTTTQRHGSQPSSITYNVSGPNPRINVNSQDLSSNTVIEFPAVWASLREAIVQGVESNSEQEKLIEAINRLASASDKASFEKRYSELIALAANHMAILAPFLPQISSLMP